MELNLHAKEARLSDALKRVTRWTRRTRFWYGIQEDSECVVLQLELSKKRRKKRGAWRCKMFRVWFVACLHAVNPLSSRRYDRVMIADL